MFSTNDLFSINIDGLDKLADLRDELLFSEPEVNGIIRRAINRALDATRAEGIRILKEDTTLKSQRVSLFRNNVRITYARDSTIVGTVQFFGSQGEPLDNYDVTPKRTNFRGVHPKKRIPTAGLSFRYAKNEPYKVRTGPDGEKTFWIYNSKKERYMVFYRRRITPFLRNALQRRKARYYEKAPDNQKKYVAPSDLRPVFAPSPVDILNNHRHIERLKDYAEDILIKRVDHEMNRILARLLA